MVSPTTSSLYTFVSESDYSTLPSFSSRMDNSLIVITKKFIKLLKESPEMELDLNYAATILEVHKRRLYDITNVLEGIGYLKKKSKNNVRYVGNVSLAMGEEEVCESCGCLKSSAEAVCGEVEALLEEEREVEREVEMINDDLKRLAMEERSVDMAYVTYTDLKNIVSFSNEALFAIKTPPGTILDVPEKESASDENVLSLSSRGGKIDVFYIQDTEGGEG